MRLESEAFTRDWVDAAAALESDTLARVMHKVNRLARGNDDDAADALPRAVIGVAGGQGIDAACLVAVGCARRDRLDRERAADALAATLATLQGGDPVHGVTATPTYESVRPTLTASQRVMLDGIAAAGLATASGVNRPDAPRALRTSVIAASLGLPAPRKAGEAQALRNAACLAWARVSVVITPGPTVGERVQVINRYVSRRKSTTTAPKGAGAKGRLKASDPNPMSSGYYRFVLPRAMRERVAARAAALGVPVSALAGYGATFVASQDGEATRAAGYRPVAPVRHAPNPSPTLKGVGEGVTWGGGGAYGLGNRETPDALAAAREGRSLAADDIARAASVHAATLARIGMSRPVWAWGAGYWKASDTSGGAGAHVRLTWDDAMGERPARPTPPPPVRDAADAVRPCARPVPSTGEDAAPDAPGCGCGARRPGARLAADGAHRLVPCETPRDGERCGCGRKAGRLVSQDGRLCHAPRVRRK